MATVKVKSSITPSSVPSGLTRGEIAVNIPDRRVFIGSGTETVDITGVRTVNGLTGALTVSGGTGMSVLSGGSGITLVNTGVLSVNGSTGAVANVALTNTTNTFTALQTFNAGISAAGGITFNSDVSVNSANTLNVSTIRTISGKAQLDIDNRANARVAIGDYGDLDAGGNGTNIFLRDATSVLQIANPYGVIEIGDPQSIDTGVIVQIDVTNELVNFGTCNVTGISNLTTNGLITANGGISASAGVTFNGTVSSDTGYRITSNAINTQTGTTYTFLESDNGKIITFNNGSAVTVTIPTALPVGFNCTAIQLGAGQVGFTAAAGVTLQSYNNLLKIVGQHGSASLIEYSTNIVNLAGNLA